MIELRIAPLPQPVPADVIAALQQIETASIGHLRHTGFMDGGIQAIDPRQKARAGVAVTLTLPENPTSRAMANRPVW